MKSKIIRDAIKRFKPEPISLSTEDVVGAGLLGTVGSMTA